MTSNVSTRPGSVNGYRASGAHRLSQHEAIYGQFCMGIDYTLGELRQRFEDLAACHAPGSTEWRLYRSLTQSSTLSARLNQLKRDNHIAVVGQRACRVTGITVDRMVKAGGLF